MKNYIQEIQEGQNLLEQHNMLLQSLLLSKQNAKPYSYTETTNEFPDGPQQPSEGISQSSNEPSA